MLPIAMVTGASVYLIYHFMPEPVHRLGPVLESIVSFLQPLLIFSMLFLTFCRIEPKELKPHRWHWWLLLIQGGLFTLLGLVAAAVIRCLIAPTATAAAVVTRKLGGDVPGITTYIILINLLNAGLIPLVVPMVQPMTEIGFWTAFSMILAKVFPLLIMPCLAAWMIRYMFPRLHRKLVRYPDLPFYIWAVALTLAIAISTRYLLASSLSVAMLLLMALVSLLCCAFQFAAGRAIGAHYDLVKKRPQNPTQITAGQSIGQKNTIFVIWVAYTFMTPETAIAGGLYSIWHNIYNSWQLRRRR